MPPHTKKATDIHKIAGWMAVNAADPHEYRTALWLFENLYFGIELPDAWINPMPSSRWAGTTAEPIATSKGATFLPLNVASLIRAVDILRGVKSH